MLGGQQLSTHARGALGSSRLYDRTADTVVGEALLLHGVEASTNAVNGAIRFSLGVDGVGDNLSVCGRVGGPIAFAAAP